MLSMLGIYLIIGIVQAFVFVAFLQIAQYFMMHGSFLTRLGQEKINLAKVNVKWKEVIGMENAKREAWELVKLLRDRHLVKSIGGKIIKGTIMIGPPGCGKTYLAKAIATECGLPLLSAVGSEFVGMFVGQGASQMRSLFKQARNLAAMEGGCIIFIDEIDSFARPRMADTGFGGGISHNATINQFLTEVDGLRKKENNIVVIAATNVPEDELDSAIMRAGRFDRKIHVTRPNLKERQQLFDFYLSGVLEFSLDEFPGRSLKSKKKEIEKLCNLIYQHKDNLNTISFNSAQEAIEWLNETILPYKFLVKGSDITNFPTEAHTILEKIKKQFNRPIYELTDDELVQLTEKNDGKKIKRHIIHFLFSYSTKKKMITKVRYDENIDTSILARRTVWFSPAEIESTVREAGIIALRDGREKITLKDLSEAYDRVSYGDKSNIIMNKEDKKWTAYHEAGHAILAYLTHPKDDVIKATIIPRKGFLGFVSHKPSEEHYSHNKEYFLAQIKICIASYVAEEMTFGSTTSGVGGGPGADFNTALTIARNMVWSYGMGRTGLIGDFQTQGYHLPLLVSERTKEILDNDVQEILQSCLKEVRDILTKHKELFEYFAEELLKKEELEYDEIQAIFDKFNVKPLSGRTSLRL